jgi:hypothetical protein
MTNTQSPITKNMSPIEPIEPIKSIFFYRSFLCFVWHKRWKVTCMTTGYTYPGSGGEKEATDKVDYFLKLRYGKRDDQQKPKSRYTEALWGKNYLLPVTNYQLLI